MSLLGRTLCVAALTVTVSGGTVFAQSLSTEEMVNRFNLQQADRGVPPVAGVTRGLSVTYGDETEVAPEPAAPQIVLQPTEPVTGRYVDAPTQTYTATAPAPYTATTPVVEQSIPAVLLPYLPETQAAPTPVALETYTPVPENARVDLDIFFEWNSASLKPQAIGQLSSLCAAITQMVDGNVFKIIGHTDKSGSDAYNLYLSQARAREVKRHLMEECAIPATALVATGEGEQQADPNAPQMNPAERRVEVQLAS